MHGLTVLTTEKGAYLQLGLTKNRLPMYKIKGIMEKCWE